MRVHQHGACIADNNHQDMGRSRGGLTSKIHAVVEANRLPVHLALTPGEAHNNRLCSALLSALLPQTVHMREGRLGVPKKRRAFFRCPACLAATKGDSARAYGLGCEITQYCLRLLGDSSEQHSSATIGTAPPLLPSMQRGHVQPERTREGDLRQT